MNSQSVLRSILWGLETNLNEVRVSNLTLDQRMRHERMKMLVKLLRDYINLIP